MDPEEQKRLDKKLAKDNKREKKQHLTQIQLGDQIVLIDSKEVMKENDRAEKQCQDNNLAFLNYKRKELFPKKNGLS